MDENDIIIKDILSKAGSERAPEFLRAQVLYQLESDQSKVIIVEPIIPSWVWAVSFIIITSGLIYAGLNTSENTGEWTALLKYVEIPQLSWSLSFESTLLSHLSKYMLFLIPALFLQFLFIHNYVNGLKRIGTK